MGGQVANAGHAIDTGDLDRIVLQVVFGLLRPGVIEFVGGRAVELFSAAGEFQGVAGLAIGLEEFPARLARAVKLAALGDDDRSTENGEND